MLLLNETIPRNEKVRILWCGKNRISITPFKPVPEPTGMAAIKSEIGQRWPMTDLLDVLKEAALDTGFLDAFETSAFRVALPKDTPDQRLLLCLYDLGTNASLKRVTGASYEELLHVHIVGQFMRARYERHARVSPMPRLQFVLLRSGVMLEQPVPQIPQSSVLGIATL